MNNSNSKNKKKNKEKAEEFSLPQEDNNANWVTKSSKFEKLIQKGQFYFKNPEKLNEVITEAYNKATNESGNKTIIDMWGKLQTLFRMIKAFMNKQYNGLGMTKVVIGIAVLLYFILPFDLLPDFIPLAGYVDDAALLSWFIKNSADEVSKFRQWESEQEPEVLPAY